jgi:exodeoxyribonuclease III
MKLISWNIRQGGGKRTGAIMDEIQQSDCDAVVLTEFRVGKTGEELRSGLTSLGFKYMATPEVAPRINSVLFAAKKPFEIIPTQGVSETDQHRVLLVKWCGINLAALYFAQNKAKASLFEFLLSLPAVFIDERSMLVGDFNTGKHKLDETNSTFYVAEYMDKLEEAGWVDAWRGFHGQKREFSWFSNIGNGFRIDHVFASPKCNEDICSVDYEHGVRERGLSDHSQIVICW